jgi:hypothetical protein
MPRTAAGLDDVLISPASADSSMEFYRGGQPAAKALATIAACGLGGFNATTGGDEPHCYVRFCRVDLHEALSMPTMALTCCCCCCLWPRWAAFLHRALDVDYFRLAFFYPESYSKADYIRE